jgi:NADH dehydrogenase [ubiquinone] 1 alpha subcomplex assembly factor 7
VSAPGLAEKIAQRIRREGPLSLAGFMAMALHDPEHGYYARRDPIGRTGDFITAPEISQIFGELIGLCCADWWQRSGRPAPVVLAELGPGRGVLMQDFLRAAATLPGFRDALRLHLVEASPLLRAEQRGRLAAAEPRFAPSFDELPSGPLLLVANEFLDALPIRQLVRGRSEWAERVIGLDGDGRLTFVETPESVALTVLVSPSMRSLPPGSVVEICPAAVALAACLGERLARSPGLALFIDYGYFPSAPGQPSRRFAITGGSTCSTIPAAPISARMSISPLLQQRARHAARSCMARPHRADSCARWVPRLGLPPCRRAPAPSSAPSSKAASSA